MRGPTFLAVATVAFATLLMVTGTSAQCPIVKTQMESWDLSLWNDVSVVYHNTTQNQAWNITMCQFAFSQIYDWGSFEGGEGSVQFHEPSDTFYMLYENGDKGEGCVNSPRQTDVYVHCQGCPDNMNEPGCHPDQKPCVCAAWEDGCVAEVHIQDTCPLGNPKYRVGFDVYDASTGIKADVSKVVVKDGEILPAWRDESTPEVLASRAVIPGDIHTALFYLMMSEGSTESTDFDTPDVFTDQPDVLQLTVDGGGSSGGTVTPTEMQTVELHFHCLRTGLADVHVEVSFGGKFYPCDFAFTYECTAGGVGGGGVGLTMIFVLAIIACGVGTGYNMKVNGKDGAAAIPGIEIWMPMVMQAKEMAMGLIQQIMEKVNDLRGGDGFGSSGSTRVGGLPPSMGGGGGDGGGSYQQVDGEDNPGKGFQEDDDESFGII